MDALRRDLERARSWTEWQELAHELDELTGAAAWREEDRSPYYQASELRAERDRLLNLRLRREPVALAGALTEALYRHHEEVVHPDLYGVALSGTKRLVEDFLGELERGLRWLSEESELPAELVRERFGKAAQIFGRSALLLSGGATWGFHHLGIVKGLFEHKLLPTVLSGASTGAMIAAAIATRSDDELAGLYADLGAVRLDGLTLAPLKQAREQGALLRPSQLHEVLRHNVGERTFGQAHAHSGRILNISVSPTRSHQKPRLLCYLTTPEVKVHSAALASSALPGFFPPVELLAEDASGGEVPYLPGELWVDGSFHGDAPKRRLSRLHNVNHFIVAQVNPYVLPFVRHNGQRGVGPALAGIAGATVRTQGAMAADLTRRAARTQSWLGRAADRAYGLASQPYRGDITLAPHFHWGLYRKVMSNPTPQDLDQYILEGERAVWRKLPLLRNQTRMGRAFEDCLRSL